MTYRHAYGRHQWRRHRRHARYRAFSAWDACGGGSRGRRLRWEILYRAAERHFRREADRRDAEPGETDDLEALEEYQRDLEQEAADVAERIRALREAESAGESESD